MLKFNSSAFEMFQCSCVAQSTISDREVALRREQIMQARRLWQNSPSEEALGELFAPCRQRVEPGSA